MAPSDTFEPQYGVATELTPGLRRIVARNPSPMTYLGTNTYLLGEKEIAVIDPGPSDDNHLKAILAAVPPDAQISHIIVTHSHLDHSPLAQPLAKKTGAPILAFGGPEAGRSDIMRELARDGMAGGGEGVDTAFAPDVILSDGEVVQVGEVRLKVLHTPGHLGNHICLSCGDICFTGDHVMGWASSLVSPPDGDLTDFMASCAKLAARTWTRFYPGHGAPIDMPNARLHWLIEHRRARERAILDALANEPADAHRLTAQIYADTPASLLPAAERNVFAHLVDLYQKNVVSPSGNLRPDAMFHRR